MTIGFNDDSKYNCMMFDIGIFMGSLGTSNLTSVRAVKGI